MSSRGNGNVVERFGSQEGKIKNFILAKDWSKTPLGDIKNWPQSLDFAVNLCLNSTFPIAIWWCKELVNIHNESFGDLFQLRYTETLGKKGVQIWPDFWPEIAPSLQIVVKEGKPTMINRVFRFNQHDGSEGRNLSFYNSPIFEEPGKVGGIFTTVAEFRSPTGDGAGATMSRHSIQTASVVLTDELELLVKERTFLLEKRNEELKLSEEKYTKMTEEVEDYAIILLDRDGTILNWNKGAQKIKGYKEAEVVGSNFSIFYLDQDRASNLPGQLIKIAAEEGRAMHEGLRKRKDGSTFWGSIVITALHDEKNNIIGFTKVTRDLTERKAAEDMIKQHAAELEIKNKQLEQFAYIASHDLQEPLRKIQTFVQVLENRLDDEEARKRYFSKINSSAKRMADLIQSVLNYSRLAQPGELLALADLNNILENVMTDYELLITEKNAVISHDHLPVIPGIPLQLSQLFANLLSNSLKFSREEPRINVSCKTVRGNDLTDIFATADGAKEYIGLVFSDNGIGFDQRYADRIFTIFQRLNSREDFAGTGIGLALCKKVVQNHNGFIYAKSEVGKGASFFIYLPYK